jgi:hypothetical protein
MKVDQNIRASKLAKVFLFACIFFSFTLKHPFYLSVTEIKFDSKTKTLQASVKLFINDCEEALKKIYKKPVDLINYNKSDKAEIDSLLKNYIREHLSVKIEGKSQNLDLIGFEREEEAVWIYLESKNCPVPKKVEIENSLLYDFIKTQTNIVKFEINGQSQSSKATNPEKKIDFRF